MKCQSIYDGLTRNLNPEIVSLGKDWKRINAAHKYMAKQRRTIVMYNRPNSIKVHIRTPTILAVRGAVVDGVDIGDVYIKEGNL